MTATEQQENEIREAYLHGSYPRPYPEWVAGYPDAEGFCDGYVTGQAAIMEKKEKKCPRCEGAGEYPEGADCISCDGSGIFTKAYISQLEGTAKELSEDTRDAHDAFNACNQRLSKVMEELATAKEREEKAVAVIMAWKTWQIRIEEGYLLTGKSDFEKALAAYEASRKEKK